MRVVSPLSVVQWGLSGDVNLNQSYIWEMIESTLIKATSHSKDVRSQLHETKSQLDKVYICLYYRLQVHCNLPLL